MTRPGDVGVSSGDCYWSTAPRRGPLNKLIVRFPSNKVARELREFGQIRTVLGLGLGLLLLSSSVVSNIAVAGRMVDGPFNSHHPAASTPW